MNTHRQNGCREKDISHTISFIRSFTITHRLIQSIITTLIPLPALFSCEKANMTNDTDHVETKVMISQARYPADTETLDIFTFDTKGSCYLDTYQHHEYFEGSSIGLRSQNGEKQIFICANGQRSRYDWAGIRSKESLDDIYLELKDERRKFLCTTGEGYIIAGKGNTNEIRMRRMASEIVLNSIRCDFRGKSYEGREISDVKVYLTNVNCRCSLTADDEVLPSSIMNAGMLDMEDISILKEPDMVFQEMSRNIDYNIAYVDMHFICYPNTSREDGPGTPFTRLVIEGKIDGETFWWPIDINREEGTIYPGIRRNSQYVLDITITRKGSSDPDIPVKTEATEIKMSIRQWKEKEEQRLAF